MTTYVALLLGVNLGKRKLLMAELRKALTEMGFENVRTVLASGNALVDSDLHLAKVVETLEEGLSKTFSFQIRVIVWEQSKLRNLHESHPFKGQKLPVNYHLYVSFFDPPPIAELGSDDAFRLVSHKDGVALYIQDRDKGSTPESMTALKKVVGKTGKVTTRNWNTIGKLV